MRSIKTKHTTYREPTEMDLWLSKAGFWVFAVCVLLALAVTR